MDVQRAYDRLIESACDADFNTRLRGTRQGCGVARYAAMVTVLGTPSAQRVTFDPDRVTAATKEVYPS